MNATINAGNSGHDVTFPTSTYLKGYVERSLIQPLDLSLVPNKDDSLFRLCQPDFVGPQKLARPPLPVQFYQENGVAPGRFTGRFGRSLIRVYRYSASYLYSDDPLDEPAKNAPSVPGWMEEVGLSMPICGTGVHHRKFHFS
jgi:hypothetical protein